MISLNPIPLKEKHLIEQNTVVNNCPWGEIHQSVKKQHILYISPNWLSRFEISYCAKATQWIWTWLRQPLARNTTFIYIITTKRKIFALIEKDDTNILNELLTQEFDAKIKNKILLKHSSLSRGEPVYMAGEGRIGIKNIILNNKSGHFRPENETVGALMNEIPHALFECVEYAAKKPKPQARDSCPS